MASTQLQFLLMSVCILITQTTKGALGDITFALLNRVVYEGSTNTKMPCGSSYRPTLMNWSQWYLFPFDFSGNSGPIGISTIAPFGPPFPDSFAIEHSSEDGTESLVVFNATIYPSVGPSLSTNRIYLTMYPSIGARFSTAGIYYCADFDLDYSGAHLVVIRADPICSSSLTQSGDAIQLSCTIVYGSYREYPIDAIMTWSVNGQTIPAENANFTINSSPTEITASSTLLINNNVGGTYECETTFSQPAQGPPDGLQGLASNLATNVPDYLKTWTISLSGIPTTGSPTATATLPPGKTTTKKSCAPGRPID